MMVEDEMEMINIPTCKADNLYSTIVYVYVCIAGNRIVHIYLIKTPYCSKSPKITKIK